MKTKNKVYEPAHFKVSKKAFEGPFKCCGKNTRKTAKKLCYKGFELGYETWKCVKCGKEYLDGEQGRKLENIWAVQSLLEDRALSVKRSLNYDGKTYFFRFPKDLTAKWERDKKSMASITMLTPEKYFVEIF